MRWPRRSSACRVKPSTLIASTGNTQGIRFRSRPPSSAPSSADQQGRRTRSAAARAALASSAACSAGDTCGRPRRGPAAGHRRLGAPGDRLRRLPVGSASATTTGITRGWRCAASASGTLRGPGVALPGLRPVLAGRAVSMTSAGLGEELQRLAAHRSGQAVEADLQRVAIDVRPAPACASGLAGCAASAASKSALCSAVELLQRQLQREARLPRECTPCGRPARRP